MYLKRYCVAGVLGTSLFLACQRAPADDTVLTLRQRSSAGVTEVALADAELNVVVTQRMTVVERKRITISKQEAAEVRALFWDALRRQPTHELTPVRGLVFEQEWLGVARSQSVQIQGYPLTNQDRRAYEFINRLLPKRYRFLIDTGFYRRE